MRAANVAANSDSSEMVGGVLPQRLRSLKSIFPVFVEEAFVSEAEKALKAFASHWNGCRAPATHTFGLAQVAS